MRDISGVENKELEHILGVLEPNSLVEHNQRIVVRYIPCGIVHFGTVFRYNEPTQTWIVHDDSGCLIPFGVKQLVDALRVYNEMKNKDTKPYAITYQYQFQLFSLGTVSNDYQKLDISQNHKYQSVDGTIIPTYNINEEFDAFISTNYKSSEHFDEIGFTSIITFWCAYPYEQMPEFDSRLVFQHSLQSIWANIDDVTKKPLSQESIPLLRAHIWNCILTRSHTVFPQIINGFLNDESRYHDPIFVEAYKEATAATLTGEAMAEYLRTELELYQISDEAKSIIESEIDGVDSIRKGILNASTASMEAFRRGQCRDTLGQAVKVLKDLVNETYEDIDLKATQEGSSWNKHVNITFMDTLSSTTTKICRVRVDQPLQEVFQLYAQRNHIPVEKLQFMYRSRRLKWDTAATFRSLRMVLDEGSIYVFRTFDRIGDDPYHLRFIKLPESTRYVEEGAERNESTDTEINFIDTVTHKRVEFNVSDAQIKMSKILKAYAKHLDVPVRDLSFSLWHVIHHSNNSSQSQSMHNKVIFISSIGKLTLEEFLQDKTYNHAPNIIIVTPKVEQRQEKQQRMPLANTTNIRRKNTNKKKKHKKSKKKRPVQIAPPEDETEKAKKQWMFSLYRVFAEAEPTFKEIRQRLNALNLERTKPKQRTSQFKATKPVKVVDNPIGDDQLLGGKAGRTQFIIQVGEVSNFYKTTKPSSAGRGRRQDDIMIDLHGLTAEEAVYRLDKHLPDWIERAMKGTYPFVIPVKIVCGGGSQILAEVVENWIKQNDNVANAPRNMYS